MTVRSLDDPDNARGPGWDGIVIDEAAFVVKGAWGDIIRPALADRRGWSMFLTTPNGYNWFKDLFDRAGTEDGWARWQRPTSDNPLVDQAELDAARRDMGPRAFAQEHEAQFTDLEGAEFCGSYFDDGIWFDEWPKPEQIRFRVMALDPSKGKTEKSDFSAYVQMALDHEGTMWVDADLQRRDVRQIVTDGFALAQKFRPDAFGVEINQFQEMFMDNFKEKSKQCGLMLPLHGIHNTENKRTRIRATLTPYLARGEFRFRRNSQGAKLLVEQLREFPVAGYDDGPDALEMAVRLMRHIFRHGPSGGEQQSMERVTT